MEHERIAFIAVEEPGAIGIGIIVIFGSGFVYCIKTTTKKDEAESWDRNPQKIGLWCVSKQLEQKYRSLNIGYQWKEVQSETFVHRLGHSIFR